MKCTKGMVSGVFITLVLFSTVLISCGNNNQNTSARSTSASAAQSTGDGNLPRKETLYMNGIMWGAPTHFNPYNAGGSVFGITPFNMLSRQLIYETLFIYNLLDGKLYPQLGETYTWDNMDITVTLNQNAKFSDGKPMTAADVVNSYDLQKQYQTGGSGYWAYIESVTAIDDYTVVIKGNPAKFNPKQMEASISALYITPKHVWDDIVKEVGPGNTALAQYPNWNPIGTGPYKPFVYDETKVVLQRVETYWGQVSSKYGKLPAPKYVAHNIFKDNASGDAAFRAGEVDVSQQFISQVWRMWENGAKVETYIPEKPYYFPGTIPFLVFNSKRPGLDDAAVRRAITMSLDYNLIGQNAMSGYTASMVASIMLPVPAEQALIDPAALKPYQWEGVDVAGANRLLDEAGWAKGSDGIRAKGGVRLAFTAECPTGWSDWQATLEIVAQSGKAIGIDIKTNFPVQNVWQGNKDNGTFDLTMHSYGGAGIASPWMRAYQAMGSTDLPPDGTPNQIQNWGRWVNQEANDIIGKIVVETDPAVLKQLWTKLNIIWLQNVPAAGLMYRPSVFHTVNTSVWEGFPKMNDGSNIPPTLCIDGYGIMALYKIKPKA